ncbi:MAG: hypothetical protein HC866_06765 [Leptolyngbyaceae cyanobacterium RU_5_1]|nr:hypothetical protein [Leptolyngbyaceae cyanobacterium RU_5_1]
MEHFEPTVASAGSITDITQRLALWAIRSPKGLARVEFSSEFARQQVVRDLNTRLAEQGITVHEIALPTYQTPDALVSSLLDELSRLPSGVASVVGFATAFSNQVPLIDALRVLNFNREAGHLSSEPDLVGDLRLHANRHPRHARPE